LPIHNAEIAETFSQYADLLEVQGANEYRVRAYRNAARSISNLPRSASELLKQGKDLDELPGIGKDLAGKIAEIVKTGKLSPLEKLKQELPPGLIQLMKLAGLGPKRAAMLYHRLGISSAAELKQAAEAQKIRELPGFASKTEEAILAELGRKGREPGEKERLKLSVVHELASPLLDYLRKIKGVRQVEAAGSYRRGMETVGDLDILVTHEEGSDVMERFVNYEDVERVIARGKTKSSVVLRFGLQVDLRGVPEESYGAALHYFTGSKAHNVAVRLMGVKRKLKINEYGVFRGDERIAGRTEKEVYDRVDLPCIEPELRENRGEIEAAPLKIFAATFTRIPAPPKDAPAWRKWWRRPGKRDTATWPSPTIPNG
jgi:DNA polymerase (family 10)